MVFLKKLLVKRNPNLSRVEIIDAFDEHHAFALNLVADESGAIEKILCDTLGMRMYRFIEAFVFRGVFHPLHVWTDKPYEAIEIW